MIIETIFFLPAECINIMPSRYDCFKCRLHFIGNSSLITYSFDLPAVLVETRLAQSALYLELAGSTRAKPNVNFVLETLFFISAIQL